MLKYKISNILKLYKMSWPFIFKTVYFANFDFCLYCAESKSRGFYYHTHSLHIPINDTLKKVSGDNCVLNLYPWTFMFIHKRLNIRVSFPHTLWLTYSHSPIHRRSYTRYVLVLCLCYVGRVFATPNFRKHIPFSQSSCQTHLY